uniref:Wall-associated receptor kinase galacturonan-binding domain-containing protein n=1 Tax=Oryza punctata TaxID=4537 RepID=A0A0E0JDS4_ORYPU
MPTPSSRLWFFLFLCNLIATATAAAEMIPNATTPSCPSYRCGHAVDIRYPFWIDDGNTSGGGAYYCGYPSLRLECRRDTAVLALPSGEYAVTHILYSDRTVSLFDLGVFSRSNTCPLVGRNLSLPAGSPLLLTDRDTNLTFFIHCSFMGMPTHLVACLEGDGRHHSYVFRDGDDRTPYGYAALCQDVVGMPVLRRSLLGGNSSPLDAAVVPALNMGFELSWRPREDGECGDCEKAGGWCGHRRRAAHEPWTFACFRTVTTTVRTGKKSPASSTVDAINTTTTTSPFCEPAKCGNLTIGYPFWLSGKHPPECGYRAFQVTCDHKNASLKNGFWTYQIQHIFYNNSSFMVTNVQLSHGSCESESRFNASSDLGLTPFNISTKNQELFFLYNCNQSRRQLPPSWAALNCPGNELSNSYAWLVRRYKPDDGLRQLPGNCTVSMMPVFGYQGATAKDYERLIKGGFLLEYTAGPGDCEDCSRSGGWCRVNATYDGLECQCPDGLTSLGFICSKFEKPPFFSETNSYRYTYTAKENVSILALLATATRAQPVGESCAPAACGDLTIKYPFWLRGRQPAYCGHPTFAVTCDDHAGVTPTPPSLNDSYLRVLAIHYGNSSVVAFHDNLVESSACRATRFNLSSSLALSLFTVSRANSELLFSANCSRTPVTGSLPVNCTGFSGGGEWFLSLNRMYDPGGPARPVATMGCQYSVVPVLPWSELRSARDYAGLVKRGFLLEWTVPGDCAACNGSGGECRHDASAMAFGCFCPGGRLQLATMHPPLLCLPLLASLLLLCHRARAECEPATCGDLAVRYPFWLGGPNPNQSSPSSAPASCGHPAFEVWCNGGVASLRGSQILVLSIDYTNSSFVAAHKRVADGGDGVCRTDFNISSSLALSPFTISSSNLAICFLYNCKGTEPRKINGLVNATISSCSKAIYAYLGGSYDRDNPPLIQAGNCTYSYLPVLWPEAPVNLTAGINYSPLFKKGFVLEWQKNGFGDCDACNASGGQCRYNNDSAAAFACLCSDGELRRSTCADGKVAMSLLARKRAQAAGTKRTMVDIGGTVTSQWWFQLIPFIPGGDLKKYPSQNYRPNSHVFSLFIIVASQAQSPIRPIAAIFQIFSWFPTHPPAMLMFLAPSIWVACLLPLILSAAAAADAQGGGEGCKAGRCGNLSILEPFGLVTEQDEEKNSCPWFGFQVTCNNSIPYLGYPQKNRALKFEIIDISYSNRSLLVIDVRKMDDFDKSSDCHVPRSNTSSKLGLPFSISSVNQNLIFYNCTKAPAAAERRVLGLVETKCRNNTFARLEERYNESVYFLEGCDAVIVPVRGRYGEANASNYEQLISDGFLLTWQPPPQQSVSSSPIQKSPYSPPSVSMAPSFFFALVVVSAWWIAAFMLAAAARGAEEERRDCPAKKCGNLTISFPFWITQSQTNRPCGPLDFQVYCNDSTGIATLRSSTDNGFEIKNISYGNRTLVAFDVHKLDDLRSSTDCHVPKWNTSAKLALPFRISSANQNLILYNCTKEEPEEKRQKQLGLVETRCRNNTFARLGGRYDGQSDYDYSLEGCITAVLPVLLTPGGKANASSYEELISRGFLITWDLPAPVLSSVSTAADTRPLEGCAASTVCGKVTVSSPFAVVSEQATESECGRPVFQVICHNHTPYLGYYPLHIQILNIFYDNGSLLVSDIHKLDGFHGSGVSKDSCHVPTVNTSSKVGLPFSISTTNLNLFLYSCNKTLVPRDGDDDLVETRCGNKTFARVGGNYGDSGDYAAFYLEGCNATIVPVLGKDARSYEKLISDGFLLTWQGPPSSVRKVE